MLNTLSSFQLFSSLNMVPDNDIASSRKKTKIVKVCCILDKQYKSPFNFKILIFYFGSGYYTRYILYS